MPPEFKRKYFKQIGKSFQISDEIKRCAVSYTHLLPDANVKIYLTASSKVRAKRRFDELTAKGVSCDMDAIEKDIIERDYRDMQSSASFLSIPPS